MGDIFCALPHNSMPLFSSLPWCHCVGTAVCLLLVACPARAGGPVPSSPTDSLRRLLARTQLPDTQRVQVLDELCWQLSRRDLLAARRYGEAGLALARRVGYRLGEARCANDLGTTALYQGELVAATRYYQTSVAAARQLPPTPAHRRLLAFALMGLGNALTEQQAWARAETQFREARTALPSTASAADRALFELNLGNFYQQWGHPARALAPLRRALATYQQAGDSTHQALATRALGAAAYDLRQLPLAETYLRQALRLNRALQDTLGQAGDLNNLALVQAARGRHPAAVALSRQARALARAAHARDLEAEALDNLAEALARSGQAPAAYRTLRRYLALNDSLRGAAAARELAALQVRYRVAQQQLRIGQLRGQQQAARQQAARQAARLRQLGAAAVALLAALLLFGWLMLRLRRSRAALARSEAALRQANRTKDQLMAVVGHDLRGPVAAFQQVQPLLTHYAQAPEPAELRALAAELGESARQMAALLDNVLCWARAQIGQVLLRPEPLAAAAVAEAAAALLRPAATAKGVQLQLDLAPDLPPLRTDADALATVLRNLLGNAVRFTPPGGTVQLRVTPAAAGQLRVEVADTGPGLPPAALTGAAPTPGTGGEVGTGLGLPLCREFVRLLGGELRHNAGQPGGARLWFDLPAAR
ncbi:sensor histidine kinase [Hymenobacter gummosus]|uniref:histidine kinase n=2 Tax=Hymenobacter gummosus TaxID=1776032 RepID=A0A431U5A5_9BACT|nr:sensor histidine kinase [Hymenobacter gummosus]